MTTWVLPPQQLVVTSFLAMLNASVGNGIYFGDHTLPANPGKHYGIVYALDGGDDWSAPLAPHGESIELPVQVTCVARQRDAAQWLGDRVNDVVLGRGPSGAFLVDLPSIDGWIVCGRLAAAAASGVQVEGKAPHLLFQTVKRYTLQVTPA